MKFRVDHDFHIHSQLSLCSNDPEQSTANILAYGKKSGYAALCLTDHFWDDAVPDTTPWYALQNFAHVSEALPLPQDEKVRFFFGCETDLDKHGRVGVAREHYDRFDFIIVPTTHLHMMNFTIDPCDDSIEGRTRVYIRNFENLLKTDLPPKKTGIAHLTGYLMAPAHPEDHLLVLDGVPDATFYDLFRESEKRGFGVELNFPIEDYEGKALETILRPFRIAKDCGCKFYFGSDAHHPKDLVPAKERFERTVDALALSEEDQYFHF